MCLKFQSCIFVFFAPRRAERGEPRGTRVFLSVADIASVASRHLRLTVQRFCQSATLLNNFKNVEQTVISLLRQRANPFASVQRF